MYKIIGSDGLEYGPVTADDVRQWIVEGRLNGKSRAKLENEAEFRALETFPEFADVFAPQRSALPSPSPGAFQNLSDDYELDLGGCLSRAWELMKNNFGPVIGNSALVLLALFGINQLFGLITRPITEQILASRRISAPEILILLGVSLVSAPVSTVLMAGLFKYYLKLIRGELTGLADAFSGFGSCFGQLFLLGLAQMFLLLIGYMLCLLPGIYLAVAWYFAVPLVIDRKLGFWAAMELSRRRVNKHWFLVLAVMLVFGLIGVAGVLACGVGLLVTMPLGTIALMYAYETIFGAQKN